MSYFETREPDLVASPLLPIRMSLESFIPAVPNSNPTPKYFPVGDKLPNLKYRKSKES